MRPSSHYSATLARKLCSVFLFESLEMCSQKMTSPRTQHEMRFMHLKVPWVWWCGWRLNTKMKWKKRRRKRKRHGSCLFCTHLFWWCRWSSIHPSLHVCGVGGGSRKKREGREKEWRDDGVGGGGGLLVISPEGDNRRTTHCNGCRVVPSLPN